MGRSGTYPDGRTKIVWGLEAASAQVSKVTKREGERKEGRR